MWGLKSILKFVATPAGILVIAFFIIQFQCNRNSKLRDENQKLKNRVVFQEIVNKALKDTLKTLGDYVPLPETIRVDIPIPVPTPEEYETIEDSSDLDSKPYVKFSDRQQWESWYREHCTGLIEFDTTKIWDNNKGARVQGQFYYGTGSNRYNWLIISPAGDWSFKPPKEGFRGGLEWLISTGGDVSFGGDLTWRKWGPAFRLDVIEFSGAKLWFGIRRNF